jgi:hypothetical protein
MRSIEFMLRTKDQVSKTKYIWICILGTVVCWAVGLIALAIIHSKLAVLGSLLFIPFSLLSGLLEITCFNPLNTKGPACSDSSHWMLMALLGLWIYTFRLRRIVIVWILGSFLLAAFSFIGLMLFGAGA